MAIRNDITIDWTVSPRIVSIDAPSVEITMQDLYDTLKAAEVTQMDEPYIIDGAGKEPLGGGVLVGITLTFNNALIEFEARSGPTYTLCNIGGGNLVANDVNGAPVVSPVSPTAFTQIVQANSSSATLQELSAIQFSSFNGGVTIDVIKGYSGTTYPIGTPQQPSNNLEDAKTIALSRGIDTFLVIGNYTFGVTDVLNGYVIRGQHQTKTNIILTGAATIQNCIFHTATLSGTLDGGCSVEHCHIGILNYIDGSVHNSQLDIGTITLSGTQAAFVDCWSGVAGGGVGDTPTIDYGISGTKLLIRGFKGGIKLINHSGTDATSIDMDSGQVVIDSTITAGIITIRGIAKLTDNSTGTAIINSADLLVPSRVTNMQYLIETLRSNHIGTGNIYYWNPVAGNDLYSGTAPELPKQSFAAVMALVTDHNHDVIIALQENNVGQTVVTDPMVITKNWVSVRGPGIDFVLRPTSTSNGALLDCTGMTGISVSGMTIDGSSSVGDGMRLDSHESAFHDIVIKNITGHGIVTQDCHTTWLDRIWISDVTLDGINIDDCQGMKASYINIRGCVNGFYSSTSSGILGNGGKTELREIVVLNATTGFNIADAFTEYTQVHSSCIVGSDVTTKLINNGTNTLIETVSGGESIWTEAEKQESLAYSKKASDNAEQTNNKL